MNYVFDLDGTLINEDTQKLYEIYFSELSKRFYKKFSINPEEFTNAMYKTMKMMDYVDGNDNIYNEFFKVLLTMVDVSYSEMESEFIDFYNDTFDKVLVAYDKIPEMIEAISVLKNRGDRLIIATDPFLPKVPVDKKIIHGGFNVNDFEFISYNSNSNFIKTSPKFFEQLFQNLNLNPEETIVVGNTVPTDIPFFKVKKAYILKDNMKKKMESSFPYEEITCKEFLDITKLNR